VTFEEIDAKGNVSDDNHDDGKTLYTAFDTVPSRSIAKVRFARGDRDIATALPFESLRVTDDTRSPTSARFRARRSGGLRGCLHRADVRRQAGGSGQREGLRVPGLRALER
jgi:hypothetical protein